MPPEAADPLIILLYHAVVATPLAVPHWCFLDERTFRNQMRYLKAHYLLLSLTEAIERLHAGALSQPAAVVTFDDGYQNNYDVAFPILQTLGIPATVFLTSAFIATNATPWFCRLHLALSETTQTSLTWRGNRYDLSGWQARSNAVYALQAGLKSLPQPQLLHELQVIILGLGGDVTQPVEPHSPFRMLSHEAIAALAASGLIEFGAHTHSHAILSLLAADQAWAEIETSIRAVQELSGRPCRLFAYPNGRAEDYNPGVMAALSDLGIQAAVTAIDGLNDRSTPPLELRRRGVGARLSVVKP